MQFLHDSLVELITQTSTNLPPDVRAAMGLAIENEKPGTQASQALSVIATNIDMAVGNDGGDAGPICQDTGMPTFVVHTPVGVNQIALKKAIRAAVAEATKRGKLRPNSVDSLTGKNTGDNLGIETPVIHFDQWEHDEIEVKLILKGGGCENKNIQYSLPMELEHLGRADRTLEGVRKCILHAVWQAQGPRLRAGRRRRVHRERSRAWIRARQAGIVPHAGRHQPDSRISGAGRLHHEAGQHFRRRSHGLRWVRFANWLQDRRGEPITGKLFRFSSLRLLGVPEAGRAARRQNRRDQ